jgi:hypothetical protein
VGRIGHHANLVAALHERADEHELGRPIAGRIERHDEKTTPSWHARSVHRA